jgi:hypothetical protein
MTLKSRLQKLANKLEPEPTKIYYMGWADCTWSASEGLFRRDDETKEEGTKYKKFKDKMKKKCVQYNKEPGGCMKELKDGIKYNFPPNNKHAKKYIMN